MKRNNLLLGGLLIIIGLLLFAGRFLLKDTFFTLGPEDFWPMIILVIGIGLELAYFISMKAPGLLIPGGILTTYGLLFFFEVWTNWKFAAYTWPVYLIGVIIGLFQFYIYAGRKKGLLIAIGIISGIAAACSVIILFRLFLGVADYGLIIPVVLVLGGLVMIFGKAQPKSSSW